MTTALLQHRSAEAMQRKMGWWGELGLARVDAELAQDGLALGADAPARATAVARLNRSIEALQRLSPHDPRIVPLLALQRTPMIAQ